MKSEAFQKQLIEYLENIIKLDFSWAESPNEMQFVEILSDQRQHPGCQFPDYSGDSGGVREMEKWQENFLSDAKSIAIATQIHQHTATCRKHGTICRFHFDGAGKPLRDETTVDLVEGKIEMRRSHPMVNNHNPGVSAVGRCNHDLKPIFESTLKSLQSLYYVTSYVTKCEDDVSDIVLLKRAHSGLQSDSKFINAESEEQTKRLITRMNHIRQNGKLFSGAQIAAMILGIGKKGTHYTNEEFITLNLYSFIAYIRSENKDYQIPIPNKKYWRVQVGTEDDHDSDQDEDSEEIGGESVGDDDTESELEDDMEDNVDLNDMMNDGMELYFGEM